MDGHRGTKRIVQVSYAEFCTCFDPEQITTEDKSSIELGRMGQRDMLRRGERVESRLQKVLLKGVDHSMFSSMSKIQEGEKAAFNEARRQAHNVWTSTAARSAPGQPSEMTQEFQDQVGLSPCRDDALTAERATAPP